MYNCIKDTKTRKTFKYRIYANKDTKQKTEEVLNLCRILYNLCLEQRSNAWKFHKKSISRFSQIKQLPELKKFFPDFKKVPSQTLQEVIERVDKAFQEFFHRVKRGEKPGYPRFKGYNRYDSFTLKQCGWKLKDKFLIISKLGTFKVKLHRPIEGTIKTVSIQHSVGKWYVCFSCQDIPAKPPPKTNKSIGIDMGCESFFTDSNGNKIDNPRFFKKSQNLLAKHQTFLSRKVKGSNRRQKAKLLVAKTHEKIKNQRRDFHFKVAHKLIKENDIICIEALKSWNTDWKHLNKSMRDVAWFNFFNILSFKAEGAGRTIIEVPAKDTSQMCSQCGKIVQKDLSVRIHHCPFCGFTTDRDHNASLNILRLGASLRSKCPSPRSPAL